MSEENDIVNNHCNILEDNEAKKTAATEGKSINYDEFKTLISSAYPESTQYLTPEEFGFKIKGVWYAINSCCVEIYQNATIIKDDK